MLIPKVSIGSDRAAGPYEFGLISFLGILALLPLFRETWFISASTHGVKSLVAFAELGFSLFVFLRYRPETRLIPVPVRVALALWLVWSCAALLDSETSAAALTRQMEWVAHGLFAYAVFLVMRWDANTRLVVFFLIGLLVYFGVFIGYWHLLPEPMAYAWNNGTPGFTNIRHLGYFAAACVPLALYSIADRSPADYAERTSKGFLVLGLMAMTVAWFFIFWTGGRGPLFALGGSLLVLILGGRARRMTRLFIPLSVTAVVGAGLAAIYAVPQYGIGRIFRTVREAESVADLSPGRIDVWVHTASLIGESPILGKGPDSFVFHPVDLASPLVQPHNIVLQAGLDWGMPGAILFLALVGGFVLWLLRQPIRGVQAPDYDGALTRDFAVTWMVTCLLAFAVIDGTLYHSHPGVLIALGVGVATAARVPLPVHRGPMLSPMPLLAATALVTALHSVSVQQALSSDTSPKWAESILLLYPSGMADVRTDRHLRKKAVNLLHEDPERGLRLLQVAATQTRPRYQPTFQEALRLWETGKAMDAVAALEPRPR